MNTTELPATPQGQIIEENELGDRYASELAGVKERTASFIDVFKTLRPDLQRCLIDPQVLSICVGLKPAHWQGYEFSEEIISVFQQLELRVPQNRAFVYDPVLVEEILRRHSSAFDEQSTPEQIIDQILQYDLESAKNFAEIEKYSYKIGLLLGYPEGSVGRFSRCSDAKSRIIRYLLPEQASSDSFIRGPVRDALPISALEGETRNQMEFFQRVARDGFNSYDVMGAIQKWLSENPAWARKLVEVINPNGTDEQFDYIVNSQVFSQMGYVFLYSHEKEVSEFREKLTFLWEKSGIGAFFEQVSENSS